MTGRAPDHLLTGLTAVPGAVPRTYVVPERRILFNALNKNACTSLKWMIADLAGENLDGFEAELTTLTTAAEAVHNRWQWHRTPTVKELTPELRAEISPNNGWFVFAVVRDPRSRIFSAWQNKLLVDHPGYVRWRNEPWFPRHPATRETIIEDFARFVEFLESDATHDLRWEDPHFRGQAELLVTSAIDYSRVYDLSEMSRLKADLRQHLESTGWSGELHLPWSNSTPLRSIGAVFDNGVRERLENLYAADFEMFGDRWDFASIESARPWDDAEVKQIDMLTAHSQRVGELRTIGIEHRDRAAELTAETARLQKRVAALEKAAAAAKPRLGAIKSRARRVARRVRKRLAERRR